ncbi:MAG: lecithin retinol acyltransferase family protein [Gammaproteobacteria bacterium]|nr:lecithin retinol acyltransferase family protein [Gammaproteobacteria bacterium]
MNDFTDRELDVQSLEPGDHIVQPGAFEMGDLEHHALYLGNGKVVHYDGDVTVGELSDLIDRSTDRLWVRHHPKRLTQQKSTERCLARLGESKYDVFFNNCEHLINWCVLGQAISYQTGTVTPAYSFSRGTGIQSIHVSPMVHKSDGRTVD